MVAAAVLRDAGPLGLVTSPRRSPASLTCAQWLQSQISGGCRVIIPEIADYEVRRELLRTKKTMGLTRLDSLIASLEFLPISSTAMRQAASFWAQARQHGYPTAADTALDGDVILAAQALSIGIADCVIATTNVGHLSRFVTAALWTDIT